jgi:hypothetical protein
MDREEEEETRKLRRGEEKDGWGGRE